MRRFWHPDELWLLDLLYEGVSTRALAEVLGRSVLAVYSTARARGLHKTAEFVERQNRELGRQLTVTGAAHRYPKGHVPANKGLRRPGYAPGRMRETQFRKGCLAGGALERWVPVGTEVRDKDGHWKRKVSDDRAVPPRFNWRYVHVMAWEARHGPVPRGCAVAFKNGNPDDVGDDNLELVTRAELMRRNSIHNLPRPLAEVIRLRGLLVRQINKRARA